MTGKRQRSAEKLLPKRHDSYLTEQDAREIVARHFSRVVDQAAAKRCDSSLKDMTGAVSEGVRFVRIRNLDGQPTFGSVTVLEDGLFVYEPKPEWMGTDTFSFQITDGRLFRNDLVFQVPVSVLNDRQFAARRSYAELKTRKNQGLRTRLPDRKKALYRLYRTSEISKLATDLQGIITVTVLTAINAKRLSPDELQEWLRATNTAAHELAFRLSGSESGEEIAPQVLAALLPHADRAASKSGGHQGYVPTRIAVDGSEWVEYGSDVHLRQTLQRIREIVEWSNLAMKELPDTDGPSRQLDRLTADVVAVLADYWKDHTGLIPTCSVPRKSGAKPKGYAAFANEVLGVINLPITPAILRDQTLAAVKMMRRRNQARRRT